MTLKFRCGHGSGPSSCELVREICWRKSNSKRAPVFAFLVNQRFSSYIV